METQEIIAALEYYTGTFPRKAVAAAIEHKDQIVPELLQALESTRDDISSVLDDEGYQLHTYALYLLAQFRDKRAYPTVVSLVSRPGEVPFDLFGDVITEGLGRILASLSCGDTTLIEQLIENPDLNEYVRCAALEALLVLLACGEKGRDEVVDYFKDLIHSKLEREYSYVWTRLVTLSYDLHPKELYEEIKRLYAEDMVDSFSVGLADIEEALKRPIEETVTLLNRDDRFSLIEDTIGCMEWWASFHPDKKKPRVKLTDKQVRKLLKSTPAFGRDDTGDSDTVRSTKTGRNQPCPCGSGKKYKHCCGR